MVLPLSGSENESQRWPRKRKDSFFFIPVHSRGIWNGINFKMAPGLSFIDRVSKNFHSVEVRHRKDYCSLCALGICCQARLGGPKRSIDADKFRFVKATKYAYSFKQCWYWLRIQTLTHIFVCGTMLNPSADYGTALRIFCVIADQYEIHDSPETYQLRCIRATPHDLKELFLQLLPLIP